MMPVEALQVVTTISERKDAETLADAILESRLAACVQLSGPIDSRYWWNGRIEKSSEWLLTIKTRRDLYKWLEKMLLESHPYDQPEIIGTASPQQANSGARINDVLSPIPPVLCLSTRCGERPLWRSADRGSLCPLANIASVSAAVSSAVIPRQ